MPLGLPASCDCFTGFLVCRLAPLRLALVPVLLAFGQRQLHFNPTIAEVESRRDQREPLLLSFTNELIQLILVHQQLPGPKGFMIENVAVFVRTDVRVDRIGCANLTRTSVPYEHGNIFNHEPLRTRKLLVHKNELNKLVGKTQQKGLTLIPTRPYFRNGRVKVELALAKGNDSTGTTRGRRRPGSQ